MIEENTFTNIVDFHGVKGLIFIDEKILVFRRDNKTNNFPLQIDLPGGGRENNESPFETFKREVKEEFGLIIEKTDVVFSKKYQSVLDSSKVAYFMVAKPLKILEKDIVFGEEGLGFMLMTPQEFLNLSDGVNKQQERVAEYLNILK
ncbi:MAG: NUDIX domain-containing protein [Candidatus Paceibacterota bacterium]|jgi:8-oxo-dGTP diphosphatase